MAQVSLTNLTKTFRHRRAVVHALKSVSLEVPAGELVVLLGASGSGKSTLLRCVAGLERADSGDIVIGDSVVYRGETRTDVPPNKRDIGMVFQNYALWPHMTVSQNVGYPLRVRGGKRDQRVERVQEVLALVGCDHLADRYASALSGGQQQRVALARALVARPKVLLFDEPLSNVDALLRLDLREQIKALHAAAGFTGIYVTHDQSEALYVGTRVAVMRNGGIEQIGTPEEVHRFPVNEAVAEFMGVRNRFGVPAGGGELARAVERRVGPWSPGERVIVYVRPEHLRMELVALRTADPGEILLGTGLVRSIAYAGDWLEYELECGGQTVFGRVQERVPEIGAGDSVAISASAQKVLVYRDDVLLRIEASAGARRAAEWSQR